MTEIDQQYYREAAPGSLAERLLIGARDRIFCDFMRLCSPCARSKILDFGVSDIINDGANLLERLYPHPHNVTAVGLGEGIGFREAFPSTTYIQTEPYAPLPFADGAFDVAVANAVLEHMGAQRHQEWMVRELTRVANATFITVPNRYFPIEHHTALPLLHYSRRLFSWGCAVTGKEQWAEEANLILMDKSRLRALAPDGLPSRVGYTGLLLGPFSSNLFLFVSR